MSNGNRIESMDQNDNNVCLSSSLPSSSSSLSGQQQTNNSSNNNNNGGIHQMRYSFQKQPFVIGVAGGTASGKSTVCSKIIKRLGPIDPTSIYLSHEKRVVRISQDSFYRKLTDDDRQMVDKGLFNFDHPTAFDVDLMVKTLRDVCDGKMVRVPIYNYNENEISDKEEIIYPADVILFEGLLLFYFPELRNMFHMKIFVDTDPDTRLSRRVMRDVKERNRDLSSVLAQYLKFVKPSFEEFCLPTKKYADIVVPRGPDNEVAVDLIVTQIHSVVDPSIRHRTIKFGRLLFFNNNNNEDCEFKQEKIINVQKSNKKQSSSSSLSLPSSNSTLSTTIEKQTTVNGHVVNGFNNEKEKSVNGFLNNVIDSIPKSIPIHIKYPNNGVNGVNDHHNHNHHASLLADEFDDMYLSSSAPSFMTHGILKFNKPSLMINNEINNENDMDFPNQRRQSSYSSSPLSTSSSSSSSTTSVSPITTTTTTTATTTTTTITKSIDNNGQTAKILMIASR